MSIGMLTTGWFHRVAHYPIVVPDGALIANLTAGTPTLIADLGKITGLHKILSLRGLQVASTTTTNLLLTADIVNTNPIDTVGAALWSPFDPTAEGVWRADAAQSLRLNVQTATATTNWWAQWIIAAEDPSLARLAQYPRVYPADKWSPADQALAAQFGITGPNRTGLVPHTVAWTIAEEYQSQIRAAYPMGKTQAVGTSSAALFVQENVIGSDEILVLAGVAVSPGSGTDGLTLVVGVDDNPTFYSGPAYPLGQGHPAPWFVQATESLTLSLTATTAVTSASVSALIWHVRKTPILEVRLGELTSGPVYERVRAGVW